MTKIKARESQNVEYKSNWHDKYLEWISGFANAQGAVMYFGVNDEHEVVGLEYIEVVIEPSNIPINYKGKYYYRFGSTMQELRGPVFSSSS